MPQSPAIFVVKVTTEDDMANSGIVWIDVVFDWCVTALVRLGEAVGLSYEEINVWLFVVAWPVVTLVMAWAIWR